jgi:hypothetical protein
LPPGKKEWFGEDIFPGMKAARLAKFAHRHAHEFGRIELIVVDDSRQRRLDLKDEATRARVRGVSDHPHLRQLFDDA